MMTRECETPERQLVAQSLLDQALQHPGVREVMEVYFGSQKAGETAEAVRATQGLVLRTSASDSSAASPWPKG